MHPVRTQRLLSERNLYWWLPLIAISTPEHIYRSSAIERGNKFVSNYQSIEETDHRLSETAAVELIR